MIITMFLHIGCVQEELSQNWQLDRTRILAAKAEPAEAQPGELVRFQSFVYTPENIESVVWFACLPESASDFGCSIDPTLLESMQSDEEPDFNALLEAGFAGAEPTFPASWTAPEDALEGLSEAQSNDGLSAFVTLSAIPEGADENTEIEVAYKRFPISSSSTPNQNPIVESLSIDGVVYSQEEVFLATTGQTYTISPNFSEDHIETYRFLNREGIHEDRTEEPYFSWFTDCGIFDQPLSLYPYNDVEWTAPSVPLEGKVITIMRDRRGGIAWSWINVEVSP